MGVVIVFFSGYVLVVVSCVNVDASGTFVVALQANKNEEILCLNVCLECVCICECELGLVDWVVSGWWLDGFSRWGV